MHPPLTLRADAADAPDVGGCLPASAGVAVFEGHKQETILIAAGGDLRALVRDRLRDDAGPRRAALAPVVARVHAATVGGAFEADIMLLELARERAPSLYAALTDRWQAWCLRLDADASPPIWSKGDVAHDPGDPETLVGPLPDKDAAGRLGERLDDLFELCRYPRELKLAPSGTACAYKEMGRCPAACDGSEPMSAYRDRVREAVSFASGDTEDILAAARSAMRAAAIDQDFELAATRKAHVEALETGLDGRAFKRVGAMRHFAAALVLPGERRGWARVVSLEGGAWRWVCDLRPDADLTPLATLGAARTPWPAGDRAAGERLGLLVSRWLGKPKRGVRRRETVFDLRQGSPAERDWRKAIKAAAEPAGPDDEPVREQDIG